MKDLRVTKSRFRGVIGFRPVAKDYRKQKREFVLVNRTESRRGGVAFTFAPAIRVTTDRTEIKTDFTRIFQTLNVRGSEFWSSQQTKVRELLSSMFSTFGKTLREIRQSTSREKYFHAKTQRRKENPEVFLRAFAPLREEFSVTNTNSVDRFTHVSENPPMRVPLISTTNRKTLYGSGNLIPLLAHCAKMFAGSSFNFRLMREISSHQRRRSRCSEFINSSCDQWKW